VPQLTPLRKVQVRPHALEARFAAASVNADERTVELCWSTGATVPKARYVGWDGVEYFDETLSLEPGHVRLERLNAGAPVLDSHSHWGGVRSQLGIVLRAWIENGEGRALVRFRQTEQAREVLRDIADGTLGAVSVGYAVYAYEDLTPEQRGAKRHLRAIDWEPFEVSLVSMPADIGAGTRSAEVVLQEVPVHTRERNPAEGADAMEEDEIDLTTPPETRGGAPTPAPRPPAGGPPPLDQAAVAAEARRLERERQTQIRALCARHSLGGTPLELRLCSGESTIDQARTAVLEELATRDEDRAVRGGSGIDVGQTDLQKRGAAMVEALVHRATHGRTELGEAGRELRGLSIVEMGRDYLAAAGIQVRGLGRGAVADLLLRRSVGLQVRTQSTSDFAHLLENVGNKVLRRAYGELPKNYGPFVRETANPDFKPSKRVQLSASPELQKVAEGAPYPVGKVTDAAESTKLETYAHIVPFTRQAIVNDDLGAFDRVIPGQARQARTLESKLAFGVLTANAAMADGVTLFHATHANVGTGVIGEAGLTAAYTAMATQKGLAGEQIELMPATIIVPVAKRVVAEQYLSQNIVPAKASDTNPFRGWNLTIVASPYLDLVSTLQWYLAAGPDQIDLVELVYLDEERGPQFGQDEDFATDALRFKVRMDVAAHAIDFRGLYRSSGA
jgi:hypothetical protein